jgi:hypothetical protein
MHPELQVVAADASGGQSFTVFADEVPNSADAGAQTPTGPKPGMPKNGVRRGIAK